MNNKERIIKTDSLGIEREMYIIVTMQENEKDFAIYTDFTNNDSGELKLYCGQLKNDSIEDIDKVTANRIISDFKRTLEES